MVHNLYLFLNSVNSDSDNRHNQKSLTKVKHDKNALLKELEKAKKE
jgi:hypothetical protein